MNKPPRNRIDDMLSTILIAVGIAAVMTVATDARRDGATIAPTPRPPAVARGAADPAASAPHVVAVFQAAPAR